MDNLITSRFLMIILVIIFRLYCSNALHLGFKWSLSRNIMYVGSYSQPDGNGTGIVVLVQNQFIGRYEYNNNVTSMSPSALTMDLGGRYLYSVNELNRFKGEHGFVSCYQIPKQSSSKTILTFVNKQPSLGWQPNFITLDPSGQFLMVPNYGTGNVVIFRLQNGRIGAVTQNMTGYGEHAHQIVFIGKHSMVAIPYLGSDVVYFYTFDKVLGVLRPYQILLKNDTRFHLSATLSNGTGPRHLVYSKDGRHMYVIGELLSTVTVFRTDIDEGTGQFTRVQVVNLLPSGYNGRRWAAAIIIHPHGQFLYASERGIHHIAVFKINSDDGKLELVKFVRCGKIPRDMAIRPVGKNFQLFVINEGDNAVQIFKILVNGDLVLDYTINGINSPTYFQFSL